MKIPRPAPLSEREYVDSLDEDALEEEIMWLDRREGRGE